MREGARRAGPVGWLSSWKVKQALTVVEVMLSILWLTYFLMSMAVTVASLPRTLSCAGSEPTRHHETARQVVCQVI